MFRNSVLLSASKTSAFENYKNEILTNHHCNVYQQLLSFPELPEKNGQIVVERRSNKSRKKSKSGGVSFDMNTNVISYDGGQENFYDDDDDDDEVEEVDVQNDDVNYFVESDDNSVEILSSPTNSDVVKLEMSSDFDQLTATNTEYNSNPINFKETHQLLVNTKSDPGSSNPPTPKTESPKITTCASSSTVPTYVSIFKYPLVQANIEENAKPKILAVKGVNGHESLVTDRMTNDNNRGRKMSNGKSHKTRLEQSPSPNSTDRKKERHRERSSVSVDVPEVPVRKSRSRDNNSTDSSRIYTGKKTGKVNKTVDERLKILAVDLESQRKSPKRPAPPPPQGVGHCKSDVGNGLGKTTHPRSTSLNLSIRNNVENGHRLDLCQGTPKRTPKHVLTTNNNNNESPTNVAANDCCCPEDGNEMINGRSRFASIRKFLRIEQNAAVKQSPDKKFRSLRRFPSPFTRSRIDLAEMRSLFHTENGKCNAANEIATDSDVVVTEITEIHSAANTLNRPRKEESCRSNSEDVLPVKTQNFYPKQADIRIVPLTKSLNKSESQPSLFSHTSVNSSNGSPSMNVIATPNRTFTFRLEETYDKMVLDDVMTLVEVADRFPDLATIWKKSMAHIVNASDLKFNNFLVLSNLPVVTSETLALYPGALKLEQEFLEMPMPKVYILMIPLKFFTGSSPNKKKSKLPFSLPVITEFQDYVPVNLFKSSNVVEPTKIVKHVVYPLKITNEENILCRVMILPNIQFITMKNLYDLQLTTQDVHLQLDDKKICFIMIQLITAFKHLQSQGIEDVKSDMDGFLLMVSSFMRMPKLVLCWESITTDQSLSLSSKLSLCHCALRCLYSMLNIEVSLAEILFRNKFPPNFLKKSPYSETFQLVADELIQGKSQSLTQAKSFLEYTFWVRNNNLSTQTELVKFDTEISAKSWLENERAKQVSNLLKLMLTLPDHVDVVEEYRIQFLLCSTPKYLLEASRYINYEKYDIIV